MSIKQGSKIIAGMGGSADGETIKNQNTSSSIEKLKMWEGTEEEYRALPVKASDTLYNTTDDYNVTDIRALGQIVQSTIPLVDAGLHLLDGSVIAYGSYKAFVDYMAGLVTDYPDLFTSEANWQSSVSTYGVCGKFVYDSVGKTVRLPKYSNDHGALIKSYSSGADWYRIYSDGWCEQGGHYTHNNVEGTVTTTLLKNFINTAYNLQITKELGSSTAVDTNYQYISSYVANSKTTSSFQVRMTTANRLNGYDWQACGYTDISDLQQSPIYEYIVVATYPKTQIEVDIDEIATDLNGKADTDLSNVLSNIDYVVESQFPTADNNYTWYRKYKSGWVEQGGIWTGSLSASNGNDARTNVALPIEMKDINYIVNITNNSGSGNVTVWEMWCVEELTTTQFKIHMGAYANTRTVTRMSWEAKGMGANQ